MICPVCKSETVIVMNSEQCVSNDHIYSQRFPHKKIHLIFKNDNSEFITCFFSNRTTTYYIDKYNKIKIKVDYEIKIHEHIYESLQNYLILE